MKKLKKIPTLKEDAYKVIMSYYDPKEYGKKNFKDFYIHGLSDETYELKIPLPPHRQTNHSIILVTKGSLIATSGIDKYTVEKDMMICIPAGQITSLAFMSKNIEGFYVHFANDYLSHIRLDLSSWLIRPVIKFANSETGNMVTLLKRLQKLNESETNTHIIKPYLTAFIAEMKQSDDFRLRITYTANERLTIKFKKLLHHNINKSKSVSAYAQELNVSSNHLNKSVKATLGMSATGVIDEMVILEAKVLMQKKGNTISEIAFETGFEDVSYFGRFFKKHTGLSPTQYRQLIELSD